MNRETPAALGADELGRYRILEPIGRGSTGSVYRARDTLIGREVAIKCVRPPPGAGRSAGELREELLQEARSAGMLSHPNVVTVYDVLELPGDSLYIAMEYVPGRSLADLLADGRPLELERTVDLVAQVASALDYLHAMGVVHRDVKPANVLLTDAGRVKLTDFGIALSGREGAGSGEDGDVLGTPEYMAPEQILGGRITSRTDVWALGVMAHEMLTGRLPFRGESVAEIVHRVVHGQRVASDAAELPEPADELLELLERALARDPERRFDGAGELAAELRRILYRAGSGAGEGAALDDPDMLDQTLVAPRPQPHPSGPPGRSAGRLTALVDRLGRWIPRRYRPAAALAAVGVVLLLAALVVGRVLDGTPRTERTADSGDTLSALDRAGRSLTPSDGPGATAPPEADRARVTVEFSSEAPEGAIMIYGGGEQLLRRGFSYYERAWLFERTPKAGGFDEELELPPGADVLWIYVARAEGSARRMKVDARVPPGAHRVLRVHLPAEGEVTAEWEG